METSKINVSKIKAAGNNFLMVGYTMIAVIVISFTQLFYSTAANIRSRSDLDTMKSVTYFILFLYIVFTIIIIVNLIKAGINLSSCDEEEFDKKSIDSETLL